MMLNILGKSAGYGGSQTNGIPMLPGRLDSKQTADILGFHEHDIAVLVSAKMLKPLGRPVPNATKYFAACEILEFAQNKEWLEKATQVMYKHWQGKTERKTSFKAKMQGNGANRCQTLESALAA